MKNKFNKISKKRIKVILLPLFFLILSMCMTITGVIQPESAVIGEQIDISVNVKILPGESNAYNLVFGFLAPISWEAKANSTATYTSPVGNGTLRLVTANDLATNTFNTWSKEIEDKVGIGENYGLVKWVVFISEEPIAVEENVEVNGIVHLTTKVGSENLKTQLGYIIANKGYGIGLDFNNAKAYHTKFTPCMEVTGGNNSLIDLCGPLPFPVVVKPAEYSLNDVINISFDASKGALGQPTDLVGAEKVYLCATATADGETKEVCQASAASMLKNIGNDKWEISIWAKQFFDFDLDADITSITYKFTNETGDVIVTNPDTGEDFELIANCSN